MRLAKTAVMGDTVTATDAYTPATTFLCQLAPVELFKIEGTAIKTRQMSCAPSVNIPARRVIGIAGNTYLVGDASPDFWRGAIIRNNHVIQAAPYLSGMTTIAAELGAAARTSMYTALNFSKFATDQREGSEFLPQYNIFVAANETVGEIYLIAGLWYLVKEWYRSPGGVTVVLANELTGTVFEAISYGAQVYDPITDAWTSTPAAVTVMRVRYTEHFKYLTKASENYERGDQQVFVLKTSLTPKVSDKLTFADGVFTILSILSEGLTWSLHVRRN